MELDPRQGDLFLRLIEGGKKDEYPNYRKNIDERKDDELTNLARSALDEIILPNAG